MSRIINRQIVNVAIDCAVSRNVNVNFSLRFIPDSVIVRSLSYANKGAADVNALLVSSTPISLMTKSLLHSWLTPTRSSICKTNIASAIPSKADPLTSKCNTCPQLLKAVQVLVRSPVLVCKVISCSCSNSFATRK